MAVYIGKINCEICNKEIQDNEEYIHIPNFEGNGLAPLYELSGKIVHEKCFDNHPLKQLAEKRIKEIQKIQKRPEIDYITGKKLNLKNTGNPENIINIFYITDDKTNPLYKYNGIQLNRKNLSKWEEYDMFLKLLKELNESGKWKGNALKSLIIQLTAPLAPDYTKEEIKMLKERYPEKFTKYEDDDFEEKKLEELKNNEAQNNKNEPYKTYKGKNYTEEEWKLFEEKQYQEYLRKKGK